MPLFLVATEADSVINVSYLTEQFQRRFRHPASRMLVFRDTRRPWPDRTVAIPTKASLGYTAIHEPR